MRRFVLGVIPARGGSKGIPRKNLARLGGRPLIEYTVEAARASGRLSRIIVSTDDPEISAAARELGAEVPFLRPASLAGDDTPMLDVLVDLLASLVTREGYHPDVLVLLQPTSPFRRAEHIDAAIDLLISSGADSVVTVVTVPHQFTPGSLLELNGDRLTPLMDARPATRRQDKPRLLARNGPAVLAIRTAVITKQNSLYGSDVRGLVMGREESFDIDDPFDLELAELLMTAREARRSLT